MTVVEREVVVVTERERRARVLEAAALEIDFRGWSRGWACREDGSVCAVGAMLAALGHSLNRPRIAVGLDWPSVYNVWGDDTKYVPSFNDSFAASAEEVKFLLRWRAEEIRDGR